MSEETVGITENQAAQQIAGLLDDDGHFSGGGDVSRAHPDYDPETDPREAKRDRDEQGRFKATAGDADIEDAVIEEIDETVDEPIGDEQTEDVEQEAVDDTDDAQTKSDDEDAGDDTDEAAFETVGQLAEALELEESDLLDLSVTFKASGEEVTANLAEVIAGYQKDADYRKGTAQLAEQRRAMEAESTQRMQQVERHNQELANALNMSEMAIAAELNDPRLADLRDSDPAEWNARQTEIGNRLAQVRSMRMDAAAKYDQFMAQQRQETAAKELKAITEMVSDWGTEKQTLARETMSTLNYSDDEIGQVMDHRLIAGVLELANLRAEVAELRELKAKAKESVQRVKKTVPKLVKPGKQRSNSGVRAKQANLERLIKRAQKSGSVEDAAAVIEQTL